MSKNKITLAIISGMLAVTAIPAQASKNTIALTNTGVSNKGMLTQVGTPSGAMSPMKGFAKDLPLETVMRQITPNGWKVKKIKTGNTVLSNDMLVSWEGGDNWVQTLNSIVKNYPLNATVYWKEKEIVLSPVPVNAAPVVAEKRAAIFELAGMPETNSEMVTEGGSNAGEVNHNVTGTIAPTFITDSGIQITQHGDVVVAQEAVTTQKVSEDGNVVTDVVSETVTVVADPVPTWEQVTGKTLAENVQDWGKKAGYRVVWLGSDYPIDDYRILSGEFDSPEGPIKQLSVDYGPMSAVKDPLTFEFLQNATLVVKNFKFEQMGFPKWNQ